MKLLNLEIQNIGPFKGVQNLHFYSRDERCVHLVVGVNGSGKTILLNTICWALGIYDPQEDRNVKRWLHLGCKTGSVKLRLQVMGQVYEISRTAVELTDSGNYFSSDSEFRLASVLDCEALAERQETYQREVFANIKPTVLRSLILYDSEDYFSPQDHLFKTPNFISWVTERMAAMEIPSVTDVYLRQRYISAVVEQIGGPSGHQAAGENAIAYMLLQSLFREWLGLVAKGPSSLEHLDSGPLPWLMDCPFSPLDSQHKIVAASIISNLKGTVVVCSNETTSDSVTQLFNKRAGSISIIRVGWNLRGGNRISILDRSLELTRNDNTEFSELIGEKY